MSTSAIEARRIAALEEANAGYLARRGEIIRTAAHVFRENGFEASTLRDVAAALGTDRASLYYYVGSKDELLHEIVRDALGRDLETAEAVRRSPAPSPEKLRTLIEAMVSSFVDNYPNMNVYMADLPQIARQESEWSVDIMERTRRYQALVEGIVEDGQADGTLRDDLAPRLCAFALFGLFNWLHRWFRPGGEWTVEQIADAYSKIYLGGYGAAQA